MRNSTTGAPATINVFVFGRQSRSVELITFILSILTMAVGAVGNLLLSLTIATSASLRTAMNTFVLSIGLVDLLTSVFLLPLRVFVEWQILANKEIDPTLYGVELFVRTFTDITRLLLMMSLSVERYQSIANPLSVSKVQAKKRAVIMSGITWTVSIILSGISIRYFCDTVLHQPCLDSTDGSTTNWGNLEVFVEMPLTILSILAIAICYSLIVLILRQQRKKMAGHFKPKMNQVMPVDSGKLAQLPVKNGSKVEISETKEKTIKIQLNSAQDVQQQNNVKPGVYADCAIGDSNCVMNKENCSDIKIDKVAEQQNDDSKLSNSTKELNKVNPDGIENNDIDVSQSVCNNSFSTEIASNTSNPRFGHDNIRNIDTGSRCHSHEEERKISTSSRSPLINSKEIFTENKDCLYEDAKGSLENQLVNDTNTDTAHITQYPSTVENIQACVPLQGTEQSVNCGTHSLPDTMVTESTTQLTHGISSSPQKKQREQAYTHRFNTAQLHLTSDNADTNIVTLAQPSLSIQPSHKHHEIQNSAGRGKPRHSVQSRGSFSKTSTRLRHFHSQRLQSVIAFLHVRDNTKDKTSNNNTLCNNSDTATGFKVIPSSQNNETNRKQVPSISKPQSLHTDNLTQSTNENTAPLNSYSDSCLSDFTPETSSRNTTLQTALESNLDNAHEHPVQNSNKDYSSITLSCERSYDYPCADDKSRYNNNLSISEIQVSDVQQKTSHLATNCINSPSCEQFTENRETKDPISMPEISTVDSNTQDIPNSLQINLQTVLKDQKNLLTDKINEKEQDKSISLPTSNIDKRVEVVDMDGTVNFQIVNGESSAPIEGAVCLMNPRNKEQGKRRVELKAAVKVGLIVCCFACLWMPLPLSVCILRGTSCWTDSMKVDMLAVFSSLATSTAAIDPILYGLLNPQIRSALQANIYKIRRKMMNYCTK